MSDDPTNEYVTTGEPVDLSRRGVRSRTSISDAHREMGDDIWRAYFPSRADQCALLKDALASRETSFLRHAMKVIARTQGVELVPGFLTDGSTFEDVVDWLDRLGFSLTVDCKRRIGERHETTRDQTRDA